MTRSAQTPVCSVIIPCRGDGEQLRPCLAALSRQRTAIPFEVIVVESSDDRRIEDVVEVYPRARLIRSDAGLLPGAARNRGVRHAESDIILFTDSDCQPASGWLESAVTALRKGARLVGGAIGNSLPLHPIAVADNLMQCPDFLSGRPAGPTDALPGGNLAIRKSDFMDLGGFREDLIVGEDSLLVDLASRSWPGKVIFDPAMLVLHRGRTTLRAFWIHQHKFGYYRSILGSRLKTAFRQRGKNALFVTYFCVRRYAYYALRTVQWAPLALSRFLLVSPILAIGLAAYGQGLLKGFREAASASNSNVGRAINEERSSSQPNESEACGHR